MESVSIKKIIIIDTDGNQWESIAFRPADNGERVLSSCGAIIVWDMPPFVEVNSMTARWIMEQKNEEDWKGEEQ